MCVCTIFHRRYAALCEQREEWEIAEEKITSTHNTRHDRKPYIQTYWSAPKVWLFEPLLFSLSSNIVCWAKNKCETQIYSPRKSNRNNFFLCNNTELNVFAVGQRVQSFPILAKCSQNAPFSRTPTKSFLCHRTSTESLNEGIPFNLTHSSACINVAVYNVLDLNVHIKWDRKTLPASICKNVD